MRGSIQRTKKRPYEGVVIDPARLRFELARRGLSAKRLAHLSHINPVTMSKARRGRPIQVSTLAKLIEALAAQPVIPHYELLLAPPIKKETAAAITPQRSGEESDAGRPVL